MSRSRPVELLIPAIDVTSALIPLGLRRDGSMQVPPKGFPAGWYTGAPTPGERGPAIIVGHVDWAGRAAVFGRLRQVAPGDAIDVERADGTVAHFRTVAVRSFDKDAFPTSLVYGNLDRAALRLITCGGSFDRRRHSYRDNVIVFADLAALPPTP
jgi:sortase (surface protein transpeptidase)